MFTLPKPKKAMLLQWREVCDAQCLNFKNHIGSILDEDIVVKSTTMLHSRIIQFTIMLECVLLENHHDLIKMQERYGIKILKGHNKILIAEYTRMKSYAEQLLNGVSNVEVKDETAIESHRGRPKGQAKTLFINQILGDSKEQERILQILHTLIDGKKGKDVARVIYAACIAN